MTDRSCHQVHPELKLSCTLSGNHERCSGLDPDEVEFVDWPNPDYVPPKKVSPRQAGSRMAQIAARTQPRTVTTPVPAQGFSAGLEGSQHAAERWDDEQKALVAAAIDAVARRHAGGGEFTSDAIWEELAGRVPVTKGLTALLMLARRRGVIESTGKTEITARGGHHDHGQQLRVWYSLL